MKERKMKVKKFIEVYMLPHEDDATYRQYREHEISYDEEFLEEVANRLNIKLDWKGYYK